MPSRPPCKISGERAECAFAWQAMEHGLIVSKPYGDSAPYDFIVQRRGQSWRRDFRGSPAPLWRIQVKSVHRLGADHAYRLNTQRLGHTYTAGLIDFFALWVSQLDAWYIIPIRVLDHVKGIAVYPHVPRSRGKYERYREAWHLLS